jgi:phytoene/squalene synthetase
MRQLLAQVKGADNQNLEYICLSNGIEENLTTIMPLFRTIRNFILPDFSRVEMSRDAANLVVASRLFKNKARASAFTFLYTFMREADDLVDAVAERSLNPSEIENISHAVKTLETMACKQQTTTGHRSKRSDRFRRIQRTFHIPEELWEHFFQSMWMDFKLIQPQSFRDFLLYAEGASVAATTIYLILIYSQKTSTDSYDWRSVDLLPIGRNLGIWAYTVHICRDLKADSLVGESGRRLIPGELLEKHGLTWADLRNQASNGDLGEKGCTMILDFLAWGKTYGDNGKLKALELMQEIPFHRARILGLIIALYTEIDRRIHALGGNVFKTEKLLPGRDRARFARELLKGKRRVDFTKYW